jgi:hypothetical protein
MLFTGYAYSIAGLIYCDARIIIWNVQIRAANLISSGSGEVFRRDLDYYSSDIYYISVILLLFTYCIWLSREGGK